MLLVPGASFSLPPSSSPLKKVYTVTVTRTSPYFTSLCLVSAQRYPPNPTPQSHQTPGKTPGQVPGQALHQTLACTNPPQLFPHFHFHFLSLPVSRCLLEITNNFLYLSRNEKQWRMRNRANKRYGKLLEPIPILALLVLRLLQILRTLLEPQETKSPHTSLQKSIRSFIPFLHSHWTLIIVHCSCNFLCFFFFFFTFSCHHHL